MSSAEERRVRVAEARRLARVAAEIGASENQGYLHALADDIEELEQVIDAAVARVERAKALADDLLRQAASQLEAAWKVTEEVSAARDAILIRAERQEAVLRALVGALPTTWVSGQHEYDVPFFRQLEAAEALLGAGGKP
jgi:hypothetical protein